jgi:hypothetical protein
VRLVATVLLWLVTTVALAVAVPSMWAQRHVIDEGGYAALAASAAEGPALQQAMADELTTEVTSRFDVNADLVRGVATAYTASASFPGQFATVNRIAHRYMFTDAASQDPQGRWVVDLAPMLADSSFQQTLSNFNVDVPDTLTVPVTASDDLRPGQLRQLSTWGPWVSMGSTILTGVFALLTLAAARARRSGLVGSEVTKALAALGVSALLVGAAGWEVLRRYIDDALTRTEGDIRQVAAAMVDHAVGDLHVWLNLTLAAGGALVVFGVIVSMLGGLRRRGE